MSIGCCGVGLVSSVKGFWGVAQGEVFLVPLFPVYTVSDPRVMDCPVFLLTVIRLLSGSWLVFVHIHHFAGLDCLLCSITA